MGRVVDVSTFTFHHHPRSRQGRPSLVAASPPFLPWSTTLQTSSVIRPCRQPKESGREGFPLVERSFLALLFWPFICLQIGCGNVTNVTENRGTNCKYFFSWNSDVSRIFIYVFFSLPFYQGNSPSTWYSRQ